MLNFYGQGESDKPFFHFTNRCIGPTIRTIFSLDNSGTVINFDGKADSLIGLLIDGSSDAFILSENGIKKAGFHNFPFKAIECNEASTLITDNKFELDNLNSGDGDEFTTVATDVGVGLDINASRVVIPFATISNFAGNGIRLNNGVDAFIRANVGKSGKSNADELLINNACIFRTSFINIDGVGTITDSLTQFIGAPPANITIS